MDSATVAQTVLQWVWPQTCAHCREDLPQGAPGPLCLGCRPRLPPCEPPYCLRCCEPKRGAHKFCGRCGNRLHACRLIRAAVLYRDAAVSVVHAFKFRGRRSAARAAGVWMAAHWQRFPELGRPDALVPMPLHPRRRRERGYNQALLIAEALSATAALPVAELALRARETKPLWALDRARRAESLAGAFAARPGAEGKKLWIVDDVCTTGASLEACARALREAGAVDVLGFAFARQGGL